MTLWGPRSRARKLSKMIWLTAYLLRSSVSLQSRQCVSLTTRRRLSIRSYTALASQPNNLSSQVDAFLASALDRASRTLSQKAGSTEQDENAVNTPADPASNDVVDLCYGQNPTITSTALAHLLWSSVLRPGIDTAVDATCGNGGDAVALARLLFANGDPSSRSELLCMDLQAPACETTRRALAEVVSEEILSKHIRVIQSSHAPLPRPRDTSLVALVVYNLGFLPSTDKACQTQTTSTLASLADAALLLRMGGLVSVMTYPRTNAEEAAVVRAFLEGLALLTSVTQDWRGYLEQLALPQDLRDRLLATLEHVSRVGDPQQTWRVHEHRKLGWTDAPILLTATRIK